MIRRFLLLLKENRVLYLKNSNVRIPPKLFAYQKIGQFWSGLPFTTDRTEADFLNG